ncbi:MAG: PPC domain-containing protein [Chloroflexi bacterium]|nr:PPC domain-containing protein [Chloroflexota bacterium]
MKFVRIVVLLLLIHGIMPAASYANPDVPQAATLEWDRLYVATSEGTDVWLRIKVVGAGPTEAVNLKFIYGTKAQSATPADDYAPIMANQGTITGLDRFALIRIDIYNNSPQYWEPYETFQVELRSDAANTVISGQPRMTIGIIRSRIMNPVVGILESCIHVDEPQDNYPQSAGEINANGGWCNSDFIDEPARALDYYRITQTAGGKLDIRLENTTPDQHDLDLYLYYRDGEGNYLLYLRSTNAGQLADALLNAPIAGNTNYLIGVYWATSTGTKPPTYRLNVTYKP